MRLGERRRVARGDVQPVDAVLDQLGHAADAGADHRPPGGARLVDHQRRVLPPDRGHHDPVGVPHQPHHVPAVVGAESAGRAARRRASRAPKSCRKPSSAQPSPPCSETRQVLVHLLQARGGVEQHQRALVPRDVAEEGEAVAPRRSGSSSAGRSATRDRVRHQPDALGVEAPVDEAVAQERARRDEGVDGREQRQQVRLAQRMARRRRAGKAAAAAVGLGAPAARALAGRQQQALVRADQLVVVQASARSGTRRQPADHRDHLGADAVEPVQVHDVGPHRRQHLPKRRDPALSPSSRVIEKRS